jgi:serine/threonine protein kinase
VRIRFYAAEVCLALKWFHDMNLLYRSLSLYEILLGLDGHIKLVDFVVSKVDISPESKTKTFCGSAEFMPPGVSTITGHEHNGLMRPNTNYSSQDAFGPSV